MRNQSSLLTTWRSEIIVTQQDIWNGQTPCMKGEWVIKLDITEIYQSVKKDLKKRWWSSFLLSPFRPCFPSSLPSSFPPFLPAPFQMHYWVKNALPCCASCSQRALCPSKNPIVFWQWPPATGIENIWPIQSLTYMLSKCLNSKEVP